MKVVGIIPARYGSSRLPGKPLKDILGHPMIWWVYKRVCTVKKLDEVYVATDDERMVISLIWLLLMQCETLILKLRF